MFPGFDKSVASDHKDRKTAALHRRRADQSNGTVLNSSISPHFDRAAAEPFQSRLSAGYRLCPLCARFHI